MRALASPAPRMPPLALPALCSCQLLQGATAQGLAGSQDGSQDYFEYFEFGPGAPLGPLAVESCEECTEMEETIYGLLAGIFIVFGVLGTLGCFFSCKGSETDASDFAQVAKCDCDYWDDIEKPFMPLFLGLQCMAYGGLSVWFWQRCTTTGDTQEGFYFIALFIVSAFFLLLNAFCCVSVRNNIEARTRTCLGFIFNLGFAGGLGFLAAIGVMEVELSGGQLLGDCTTQFECVTPAENSTNGTNASNRSDPVEDMLVYNGSGSWEPLPPCPENGLLAMFGLAFNFGTLLAVMVNAAGNCIFGYVLTIWGTKARAVILTLNALVAADFMGAVQLSIDRAILDGFSPDLFNSVVMASNAAGAMAAAALKLEKASYVLQGAGMGRTAIVPILISLERPLQEDLANCTGVGDPTAQYPNGEWLGCDPEREMAAAWILQAVNMGAIGFFMNLATKQPRLVGCLSAAMMGADMVVANLVAVLVVIAPDTAPVMEINRAAITYGASLPPLSPSPLASCHHI